MEAAQLRLLNYQVDNIEFALNEEYDFSENQQINLNQNIERNIVGVNENQFKVSLKFYIYNLEENPMPFTMLAVVSGMFELQNWQSEETKDLVTTNTVAILFPFLRALVAAITSNANVPPYILPVVNISTWLDQNEKLKDDVNDD